MDVIIKWGIYDIPINDPEEWQQISDAIANVLTLAKDAGQGDVDVEVRNEE